MITKEKLQHHIKALQEKHDKLDKEVKDMFIDGTSDLIMENAKKRKLKLRDEIERCKEQLSSLPS